MKNKILLLVGVLFLASFIFIIPSTKAITRDQIISTITEKDSHVRSDSQTSNYGGQDYLIFGNYLSGWSEAYLFFNFSDKPVNWTTAEISINMYSISETFNVTVSLINETWDEYTINWLNKPVHREVITTFLVNEEKIYKINITDYIEGRDNISICLNASNYLQNGYVQGSSREGAYYSGNYPKLIWTYPETAEITVTSPKSSDIWQDFGSYTIKWTSQGLIDNVIIQLYKGTTFIEDITYSYSTNDGEYDFYVSSSENYKGTDYRIKITDYDDSSVYGYSGYFTINIGSGTITVTSPSNSSSWKVGSSHSITWTTTGTIINVDIEIYKGDTLKYYIYDVPDYGFKLWEIDEDIEVGTDWRVKVSNSDDSSQNDWSDYFTIYKGIGAIPGYSLIIIIGMLLGISLLLVNNLRRTYI